MVGIIVSRRIHRVTIVLVAALITCAPAEARIRRSFLNENVKSDVSNHIYKVDELNQDCTLSRVKVKVWTYPEHGSLQLLTGTVKNTYNHVTLQSKCSRTVPNGIRALYRPNAGYKGKDEAVFYALDPAGNALFTTIYLTVR
jgi:hypothetical protein